jgi:hypothetical protein
MTQTSATFQRADAADAHFSFESPILLRAADAAQYDDDSVMDSWLASLDAREFEGILSRLAESDVRGFSSLEFSA